MTRDVLELLREADPLRDLDVPDPTDQVAVAMREAVVAGQATAIERARRRRRRWAVGAVAAAAAAATAAAIAVSTSPVTDPLSVGCYDGPSTTASTTVLGATGGNPVAACRELWEQGEIDPAVTREDLVPPLVACVLETAGVVGVFPAASCDAVTVDDAGASLRPERSTPTPTPDTTSGVARSPSGDPPAVSEDPPSRGLDLPDFGTDDQTVREAMNEIRLALLDRCVDLPTATALAEEVLARHGLDDWTVAPLFPDQPEEGCTGFFPQASDQAVWLPPHDS